MAFDEAQATITNTSGFDWQTGKRIVIQLDRSSRKPPMNTAYAISSGVPLPRPQAGSPARNALNKTAAKRNAEGVLRALADMGLAGHKVSLSAATSNAAENNEVRIFVR